MTRIINLLKFIRNYRIKVSPTKRLLGVRETLIGWILIAISTVFFSPPQDLISSEINFIFFFLSGSLALLAYAIFENLFQLDIIKGLKKVLIIDETATEETHLTSKQRIKWIYFRGIVATGGYMTLNIAKLYFGIIDNSQIFGADALVYALLAFLLLGQRYNFEGWLGICIASFGVLFILFVDVQSFNWGAGLIGGSAGIVSALAMTIIFFITGIIVRHDTPLRVAFHQCIAGLALALVIFICTVLFKQANKINFSQVSIFLIKNAIVSGVLYAIALIFFLKAFLYTEPIVIAVAGYSLGIFVALFEWLFLGEIIRLYDIASAFFIAFGCFLLLRREYKIDKKEAKTIRTIKPIYQKSLRDELISLGEQFREGKLDRYTYLAEKHEFNKVLIGYSSEIKNSIIKSIEILPDSVIFNFQPHNIQLETDGGARSAPFEVLNFGKYEPEDEKMAENLIKDGDAIIDVGANIGWYTINFAKKFPNSKIVAFEPIEITFDFLKRNVERNKTNNVTLFNYGLYNKEETRHLYYFKGGSAIASIENLIHHKQAKKIKCHLKTLDQVIKELKIERLNFIKCDAEGSELYVLQGGEKTINKFRPIILIELYEEWCQKCGYSSLEVVNFLKLYGYEPFQAFQNKLKKISYPQLNDQERYNYFFLNPEIHSNMPPGILTSDSFALKFKS